MSSMDTEIGCKKWNECLRPESLWTLHPLIKLHMGPCDVSNCFIPSDWSSISVPSLGAPADTMSLQSALFQSLQVPSAGMCLLDPPFWIWRLFKQNSVCCGRVSFWKLFFPKLNTHRLAWLFKMMTILPAQWVTWKQSHCAKLTLHLPNKKTDGGVFFITFAIQWCSIPNRACALHVSSEHHFLLACSPGTKHSELAWISEPAESAWISEQEEQEAERE